MREFHVLFPKEDISPGLRLFLAQPRQKNDSGAVYALSPQLCFRWFSTLNRSLLWSMPYKNKTTNSEFLKKGTLPPSDEIVWKGQVIKKRTLAAMAALSNDFPHSFRPVR